MRTQILVILVVAGLLAVACGADATPAPMATPTEAREAATPVPTSTAEPALEPTPSPTTHKVEITGGRKFSPANITIAVGDTVEWTVTGSTHTTTSGHPGNHTEFWDSDTLGRGGSFSRTFTEVGGFPYFCRIHGRAMLGTVTVVQSMEGQPQSSPPTAEPEPDSDSGSYGLYDY